MSANTFTNYSTPGNSGYLKYGLNNIGIAKKVILFPKGMTIADKATAILPATWTGLAKNPMATRIHPFVLALDVKPTPGATKMQKTALGGSIPLLEEPIEFTLTYNVNQVLASIYRKFNFKQWDIVFVDTFGNILGTTPDGTKFKGLSTTSVHWGQMSFPDGSKSAENMLYISLAEPMEWNAAPAMIEGNSLDWFPLSMEGTTAVNVTVSGATTAGFTASVNAAGLGVSDPRSAYPGLAKADFVCLKAGVSQSLSGATMTDNGDGTYGFAITLGTGNYTLGLVAAGSNSVSAYNVECPTVGTFTVS